MNKQSPSHRSSLTNQTSTQRPGPSLYCVLTPCPMLYRVSPLSRVVSRRSFVLCCTVPVPCCVLPVPCPVLCRASVLCCTVPVPRCVVQVPCPVLCSACPLPCVVLFDPLFAAQVPCPMLYRVSDLLALHPPLHDRPSTVYCGHDHLCRVSCVGLKSLHSSDFVFVFLFL